MVILALLKQGRRENIPSFILCKLNSNKSDEIEPGVFVQAGVKRKVTGIFEEVIDIEVRIIMQCKLLFMIFSQLIWFNQTTISTANYKKWRTLAM